MMSKTDNVVTALEEDAHGDPILPEFPKVDKGKNSEATSAAVVEELDDAPDLPIYKLKRGKKFDGVEYRQVAFREMTGNDIFELQRMRSRYAESNDEQWFMLILMTDLPIEVCRVLSADDALELLEIARSIMPEKMRAKLEEMAEQDGK